jgi:hypothetical protein
MLLDATQGEEKLRHTESNREHVWRLLQGGELIAPVPPLPPRGAPANPAPPPTEDVMGRADTPSRAAPPAQTVDAASAPPGTSATARQQDEVHPSGQETVSVGQTEPGGAPAQNPPKRRRRKTAEPMAEKSQTDGESPSAGSEAAVSEPIDGGKATSPTKPKRSRRVGEPKPRRYPVGEHETDRETEAEQT